MLGDETLLDCAWCVGCLFLPESCDLLGSAIDKMNARMAEERLCAAQTNAGHLLLGCRGATDADIEIARRMLYSAYKVDFDDFNASHKNMGGCRYSYVMATNAEKDFEDGWHKVATN